jgi:hypothetical protein
VRELWGGQVSRRVAGGAPPTRILMLIMGVSTSYRRSDRAGARAKRDHACQILAAWLDQDRGGSISAVPMVFANVADPVRSSWAAFTSARSVG